MIHLLHNWDPWSDVCVFSFAGYSRVLQGRKCGKCNMTVFRVASTNNFGSVIECGSLTRDQLEKAGLWYAEGGTPSPVTPTLEKDSK